MKLLNEYLGQSCISLFNDTIDTAEVVSSLNNIIHLNSVVCDADGVSLKDIPCLVVGQTATLDVVGVIGEIYLDTMIDTSLNPSILLLLE